MAEFQVNRCYTSTLLTLGTVGGAEPLHLFPILAHYVSEAGANTVRRTRDYKGAFFPCEGAALAPPDIWLLASAYNGEADVTVK